MQIFSTNFSIVYQSNSSLLCFSRYRPIYLRHNIHYLRNKKIHVNRSSLGNPGRGNRLTKAEIFFLMLLIGRQKLSRPTMKAFAKHFYFYFFYKGLISTRSSWYFWLANHASRLAHLLRRLGQQPIVASVAADRSEGSMVASLLFFVQQRLTGRPMPTTNTQATHAYHMYEIS